MCTNEICMKKFTKHLDKIKLYAVFDLLKT